MNAAVEQFRDILLEAVPVMEGAQALLRQDDTSWILAFSDEVALELHVDERMSKLVLCMPLGRARDEQSAATHRALLVANGLWRETGGLRFALESPDGEIEQCLDLNLNEISAQDLIAILRDFADRGRVWRDIIMLKGGLSGEESEQHNLTFGTEALRV